MNILEPAPVDSFGNEREDVMQANEPVDLTLLPGLAFDKSGRRMGCGGGYYDTFLKKYQELAKARDWRQPRLVALSYSLQIMDGAVIAVTPNDVSVDARLSGWCDSHQPSCLREDEALTLDLEVARLLILQ